MLQPAVPAANRDVRAVVAADAQATAELAVETRVKAAVEEVARPDVATLAAVCVQKAINTDSRWPPIWIRGNVYPYRRPL